MKGYDNAFNILFMTDLFELLQVSQYGITLNFLAIFPQIIIYKTDGLDTDAGVVEYFPQQYFTAPTSAVDQGQTTFDILTFNDVQKQSE